MVTLHWQWLVFIPVVLIVLYIIFKDDGSSGYGAGLDKILWVFGLIAFVLFWGGIFWW